MGELLFVASCSASAVGWASLGARRAGDGRRSPIAYALFGGAAAFGLAVLAYEALGAAGVRVEWERLVRGELAVAVALAVAVGLVEEGAKLAGILLVVERGWRTSAVLAASVGVSAGFAALEALTTLHGWDSPVALARVALGPAAHALLALPLGLAVAADAGAERRPWAIIAVGLAVSAGLHAAGDLSLARAPAGQLGYALALLAAPLWVFVRARLAARSPAAGRRAIATT